MIESPPSRPAVMLKNRWQTLCERYLPITRTDSIWRYSRQSLPDDPEQGWKLHVSATILNAGRTLTAIGPFLTKRNVLFKAPRSLVELSKLNTGIFYGYSQVGKFLTIYPRTIEEAVLLADELYPRTRRFVGPSIPLALRYARAGSVYYRYGAFNVLELETSNGDHVHAIRDPDGKLVEDVRDSVSQPGWVADPFVQPSSGVIPTLGPTPLKTTCRAFRALGQRGKGGVYQAIDDLQSVSRAWSK